MQVNFYKKTGFTLIELMVVIAIIGVLSTIMFASFDLAKKQSRDKIRMASLKELQLAIELYKAQNGVYPQPGCGNWSGGGPDTHASVTQCANYIVGLVPDFLPSLPLDPLPRTDAEYIYRIDSAGVGTDYKLMAWKSVESITVESFADKFARCSSALGTGGCPANLPSGDLEFNNTYAVYSSGAVSW
jgi:prepilin-type N-terminal cleavage/methylation domain-containing protein